MIKFSTIGQIEHGNYPFEDAVASADTFNGAYGDTASGKFTVTAKKYKAIMHIERGDDEGVSPYKIAKGERVRVVDLAKVDGGFEIYGDELPSDVAKGDKLESNAEGKLVKNTGATAPYIEVTAIIGNKLGVEAKLVTA